MIKRVWNKMKMKIPILLIMKISKRNKLKNRNKNLIQLKKRNLKFLTHHHLKRKEKLLKTTNMNKIVRVVAEQMIKISLCIIKKKRDRWRTNKNKKYLNIVTLCNLRKNRVKNKVIMKMQLWRNLILKESQQ